MWLTIEGQGLVKIEEQPKIISISIYIKQRWTEHYCILHDLISMATMDSKQRAALPQSLQQLPYANR